MTSNNHKDHHHHHHPDDQLKLTIFLRPTTALPPPAYGALGLSFYLKQSKPDLKLTIDYQDGQTGTGKDKSCQVIIESQETTTTSIDSTLDVIRSISQLIQPPTHQDQQQQQHQQQQQQQQQDEINRITHQLLIPLSDPSQSKLIQHVTSIADRIDHHLTLRTFLLTHSISYLDWALWGIIKSSSTLNLIIKQRSDHPHLSRWFNHIDSLESSKSSVSTLQDHIKRSIKDRSKAGVASINFDQGLPNATKGQVVTRFPPEPSGYLHIGHCKAAILNQHYAKIYQGQFLVRFDDTNPSKEKEEFQDAILQDLELLDIKGDRISYTSDHFEKLYRYAIEMISSGKAYCDDTTQEVMKSQRMARQPSTRRDSSIQENLSRFEEMKNGTTEGLRWCLRAKIRYDDVNGTLRDPVIYRCNLLPHHRTGEKWKIYPTYDFACPIVDSIEGVTHALRTNEYRDRNPQYWWMQEALGLRRVEIKDFARVNFVYTLLSKRKLKWFVDTGRVRGWDDPRFATVRGIRRRGMTIQAMRDFMIGQGDSQQQVNMEWDVLWSINKRIIDPIVPRFSAISTTNKVMSLIKGGQGVSYVETIPRHKKNPEVGSKKITFSPMIYIEQADASSFEVDEEITLMDWGNAIVRKKSIEDGIVNELELELHLEGDFKKTKKKVNWLTTEKEDKSHETGGGGSLGLQNVVLLDYDYLITKRKIDDDDEIDDFITPVSEFIDLAIADGNIRGMKKGDMLQFERKGYYIIDKPIGEETSLLNQSGKEWIELIKIPDGRAAGIASKATPNTTTNTNTKPSTKLDSSTSKMFKVKPIYEDIDSNDEPLMNNNSSKMYVVDPIYQS